MSEGLQDGRGGIIIIEVRPRREEKPGLQPLLLLLCRPRFFHAQLVDARAQVGVPLDPDALNEGSTGLGEVQPAVPLDPGHGDVLEVEPVSRVGGEVRSEALDIQLKVFTSVRYFSS